MRQYSILSANLSYVGSCRSKCHRCTTGIIFTLLASISPNLTPHSRVIGRSECGWTGRARTILNLVFRGRSPLSVNPPLFSTRMTATSRSMCQTVIIHPYHSTRENDIHMRAPLHRLRMAQKHSLRMFFPMFSNFPHPRLSRLQSTSHPLSCYDNLTIRLIR